MKYARLLPIAFLLFALTFAQSGCKQVPPIQNQSTQTIQVVATTSIVADLVDILGGEHVHVEGLMGPGVDPHLYKASEGDVLRMAQADVIFYNGLHLEGKMTDVFEQMQRKGIATFPVAQDALSDSLLLESDYFQGSFDPHVWFDVSLWKMCAVYVTKTLTDLKPDQASYFTEQFNQYEKELDALHIYVHERANQVAPEQRVLITSHDAFGYFGSAYGFEVKALQGLSTVAEAGTADVQELASFVATRKIPAIFVESSVSPRGIEAVKAAVESRDFMVSIGGNLFSDALGSQDTPEGTYVGTVRHNVDTIVNALTPLTLSSE